MLIEEDKDKKQKLHRLDRQTNNPLLQGVMTGNFMLKKELKNFMYN